MKVDEEKKIIYLSQIFKWYASDFGENERQVVKTAVIFASDRERDFLKDNKEFKVRYLPYDWNLNRTLG